MKYDLLKRPRRNKMKTFSHLSGAQRLPSEYELVTTHLLYYPEKGFEIKNPVTAWYEIYQKNSKLKVSQLSQFADPRETTYSKYVHLQNEKGIFVDRLFQVASRDRYFEKRPLAWRNEVNDLLAPLLFCFHGLQMGISYIGALAPEGRITICCALQAGDEIRRTQVLGQYLSQLNLPRTGKDLWTFGTDFQGLRKLIENLLVTYDWTEAFWVLSLMLKPRFDHLLLNDWRVRAWSQQDHILAQLLESLWDDSLWHQAWSQKLAELILRSETANKNYVEAIEKEWIPKIDEALLPLQERMENKVQDYKPEIISMERPSWSEI